jgi:hypothetical protein
MTCPSCKLENPKNSLRCDCGYSFATAVPPTGMPVPTSPDRKRAANVLLVLGWLWVGVKTLQLLTGGMTARALDFTNPSLFGIIGFGSLVAYFFVRPKKQQESAPNTHQSDDGSLRVSVVSKEACVAKVGKKYRFRVRVEGSNDNIRELGWSGVTINVPTIDSPDKYHATEVEMTSVGCNAPSRYGPGEEIWGFLADGSFGKKAAQCLLLEAVRERWPPHERIALEADLLASCTMLDFHVRVWSTNPDTRDGFGDPDWKTAIQKDQQGISTYPLSVRSGLWEQVKLRLRFQKRGLGDQRVREGKGVTVPIHFKPNVRGVPVPLRSSLHPAHAIALEADALADQRDRSNSALVEFVDQALVLAPNDADLLYAKACAVSDSGGFLSEKGAQVMKELRALYPNHIDASLTGKNFAFNRPLPPQWEGVFYFSAWSQGSRELKGLMESRLIQGQHLQLVRHCLVSSIAVVWGADKAFCDRIRRMRWELRWAKTPYGNVAAHYVVMDWGDGESRRNEAFIPHSISNPPSPRDGYCLLQRLAQLDHCFLVLCDDEENVLRNEIYEFPAAVKRTLREVKRELDAAGPVYPLDASPGKAQRWYMDNTDVKSIKF